MYSSFAILLFGQELIGARGGGYCGAVDTVGRDRQNDGHLLHYDRVLAIQVVLVVFALDCRMAMIVVVAMIAAIVVVINVGAYCRMRFG